MPKTTKRTAGTDSKNYVGLANDYITDVLNGTVAACKWVQLACQRQRDDLKRWKGKDSPYLFSPDAGSRICRFIELLPHTKGPKAGTLIEVEPWQCFALSTPFGWKVRSTGKRRFRRAYQELPRGNAKSTMSSGVGLYMGFADGEGGAEVYSAATTQKQARIVLDAAQDMARRSPAFRDRFGVEVSAHKIYQLSTSSYFEALSSEDDSLDGKNIHLGIIDELHAHKTRGVYDVLETGVGKRDQSMLWTITTAGWNVAGICFEVRKYLTRVLEGNVTDEQFFGIIYTIDNEPRWELVQSSEFLLRLDYSCTCRNVQPTQIEKFAQEACAGHATTNGTGLARQRDARITQIGRLERGACAELATSNGCSIETQSESLGRLSNGRSGLPETQTELRRLLLDGETRRRTVGQSSINSETLSTGLLDPSTMHSSISRGDCAEFAGRSQSIYVWITAMLRARFGGSSAGHAIRQSAFSEILNRIYDEHSPTCKVRSEYRICDGHPQRLVPEDDWTSEYALKKANPNYGISVEIDTIQGLQKKAREIPSAVNNFLTKHLNVWCSSDVGLFDMRAWAKAADTSLKPEQFKDYPCWVAIDLGFVDDIAAVVQTFKVDDGLVIFGKYYLPEATVEGNRNSQYSGWERSGYITQTDGSVTDIGKIVRDISGLLVDYNVQEIPYDPYGELILLNTFHEHNFPTDKLLRFPQEVKTISPATERLMQLVAAGKVRHDGNPVLSWAMGNVIGKFDAKDNVYPRKESPDLKIDPVLAAIMNTGRIMVCTPTPEPGFIFLN